MQLCTYASYNACSLAVLPSNAGLVSFNNNRLEYG